MRQDPSTRRRRSEYLTVGETAQILRTSPQTIRRAFDKGELIGYTVGSDRRIQVDSVRAFMWENGYDLDRLDWWLKCNSNPKDNSK